MGVAVGVALAVFVAVAVALAVSVAVSDGAITTVWVNVADGARTVAEGVFIGDALSVLVGLLVAVRVLVRGFGIVRVAVRVFVRGFVLVSVATRACTLDPPDACGASGHCKQATKNDRSTIPVTREDDVPIQPRFNDPYSLPTIFDFPGPSLPNSNQPHASVR